ncbi:MAG: thiamine pyrophosphate-requiring protein [Burkholderiaceae bacterium]|nr:MAG: thiamine pyrophosphate-requiring protein [Burkholderiaceae bacterium]
MAEATPDSVAYRLLAGLGARGISTFLANAGTDFAPLIEARALGQARGATMPRFINVPHEQTAVTVAHGAHLINGLPQVVGVHHTVGTANTVSAVMTASRERIPLLLLAGRTPSTERGNVASRDVIVHWGTDTFDQAALIREYTKWDYELRDGQNIDDILDRALDIAMTAPRGPVYLTLPREVLAAQAVASIPAARPRAGAIGASANEMAIAQLADWLMAAQQPLIITSSAGRDASAPPALAAIAEMAAIPVIEHYPRVVNLPEEHLFHAGFNPSQLVTAADLIIVIDCEVPWLPRQVTPQANAKVAHIGADPLYTRIPVRSFPVDLAIVSDTGAALQALSNALMQRHLSDTPAMTHRRELARQRKQHQHKAIEDARHNHPETTAIDFAWVSACVRDIVDQDTVVLNEYGLNLSLTGFSQAQAFFSAGISGALGWTMAAALGVQMAAPNKTAIAVVGDGSYIFGNPVSCHYLAQAEHLPIVTVLLNNGGYAAVTRAVEVVYPDGVALQGPETPLARFEPQPSYEGVAAACGAYSERVESRSELPQRLQNALNVARTQHRQVLLNVICQPKAHEETS